MQSKKLEVKKLPKNKTQYDVSVFFEKGILLDDFKVGSDFDTFIECVGGEDLVSISSEFSYCTWEPFLVTGYENRIIGIELDFKFFQTGLGSPFKKLKKGMPFSSVIRLLSKTGIKWRFDKRYVFDDQLAICTKGNVHLLFGKEVADIQLDKIASTLWEPGKSE